MPLFFLFVGILLLSGLAVARAVKSPPVNKSLDMLQPDFRRRFELFLQAAAAEGKPLKVSETYRTPERQAWLYGQGRASYVYKGIEYGRPDEPVVTQRSPENPSEHQRTNPDGSPGAKAADTYAANLKNPFAKENEAAHTAYLRSLEPVAARFGLKNLPSIKDYGHWENA